MNKLILYLIKFSYVLFIGKIFFYILKLIFSIEVGKGAKFGNNVVFNHLATGLVVHQNTKIADNVILYQGVTLGRADVYCHHSKSKMLGIEIDEGAIICAGAKVLCKEGTLRVGKNTIIGANAVLTCSTGDNEIWGGIPARKLKDRIE